jgi:hypothetical protein
MEMNNDFIIIFKFGILPLGLTLCFLGTIIVFKNFKGYKNIKILGATWLFLGATLILYYVRSIL